MSSSLETWRRPGDELHLHDRAQAVSHALRRGLVALDELEEESSEEA